MNAELLLRHFDRITDAQDAVPRLRRFVLDLAVRGKLVEQEPRDEPASGLIQRIQREKIALIKSGEARKEKSLPKLDESEAPFLIPNGWRWSQLAEIGFINPRNAAEDQSPASFVPMSMISAEYGVANSDDIRPWGEIKSGFTHFAEGDVGLAKITPCFENGKSTVFRNLKGGIGAGTTELHIVRPVLMSADYILIFLKSPHFIESGIPKMTGTAGQKRVSTDYFANTPFPLPPLAEQHRIVAKVDELMGLCDRLEAAQRERECRRDRLAASTHHHLNNGGDAEELRCHAQFFIGHLPRLTTRPDQVKQLRQTILNLAVVGKLDTQHVEDMPVSELLRRKATLPAGYNRRRKIMKETSIAAQDDCFPRLPSSWQYKTVQALYDLNVIVDYADGNHGALYPRASEFGDTGVLFVTAKDLCGGKITWEGCARLNETRAMELHKGWAQGGDVLLTHNATVGRVARVEPEVEKFLLGTSVTFYRVNNDVLNANYLFHFLQSHTWQGQLQAIMQQTTRNQVSIQKQAFFLVAVPPLAEQRRIVAKVDELMTLCDQLEASLTTAQTESSRLLDSVLHHALQDASVA